MDECTYEKMPAYIGTKIVSAIPRTKEQFYEQDRDVWKDREAESKRLVWNKIFRKEKA